MEWKPGTVVRNAGGHDVGFFMVVSFDGKFVYIANGKSRLLEKPKKKNPKHLSPTRTVLDMTSITTDKKTERGTLALQLRYGWRADCRGA